MQTQAHVIIDDMVDWQPYYSRLLGEVSTCKPLTQIRVKVF